MRKKLLSLMTALALSATMAPMAFAEPEEAADNAAPESVETDGSAEAILFDTVAEAADSLFDGIASLFGFGGNYGPLTGIDYTSQMAASPITYEGAMFKWEYTEPLEGAYGDISEFAVYTSSDKTEAVIYDGAWFNWSNKYTVSVASNDSTLGTVYVNDGSGDATEVTVEDGTSVVLKAVPTTSAVFEGWYTNSSFTGAALTDANPETTDFDYIVTSSVTLYAKFSAKTTYTVTAGVVTGNDTFGSASADPTGGYEGDSVTVTATANPGYHFVGWYSDPAGNTAVSTINPYTFTIGTSNAEFYAKFEADAPAGPEEGVYGDVSSMGIGSFTSSDKATAVVYEKGAWFNWGSTAAKVTPTVKTKPTAAITYGDKLSAVELTGGAAEADGTPVAGTWTWKNGELKPAAAGTYKAFVVFTPADADAYETVEVEIDVTVNKKSVDVTFPTTTGEYAYGTKLSAITLNGGSTEYGTFAWTNGDAVPAVADTTAEVTFTPTDTANYNYSALTANAAISIKKAEPKITVKPTASGYEIGQAVSAATLSGGTVVNPVNSTTVAGTWSWKDSSVVITVGENNLTVVFTPADAANYTAAETNIVINTSKVTPTVSVKPTADNITVGQKLSDAAITGGKVMDGDAEVAGSWAWAAPDTTPAVGDGQAFAVTFTPENIDKYNTVTDSITVNVVKKTAVIEAAPAAADITEGDKLAVSAITPGVVKDGDTVLEGTWSWKDSEVVPAKGEYTGTVVFTPAADADNYNPIEAEVTITVNEKVQEPDIITGGYNEGVEVKAPVAVEGGVKLEAVPAAGKQFVGWYTKNTDGTYTKLATDTVYTYTGAAGVEIVAVAADAAATSAGITVDTVSGGTASVSGSNSALGDVVTVTATANGGYNFSGWKDASGNIVSTSPSYTFIATGDVTLTPQFTVRRTGGGLGGGGTTTYKVTFVTNNDETVAVQSVVSGKTAVQPAALTKEGYTFDGWYTDAAFTNKFDFSAKITANVTLYAKWTENEKEDDVWKLILYVDNKTALVGGKEVEMDVPATILNDRTMTPSRFVAENLGAEVAWNEDEQLVTITLGDIEIKLTIDSTTAYVNGEAVELDQPATIVNDRTLAPARFVAENLGAKVAWDEAEQMITITK